MRSLVFILLLLPAGALAQRSLAETRALYDQALYDKKKNRELVWILQRQASGIEEKGYLGAALMLMARHGVNPFRKHGYFSRGKQLLEEAIATVPDNVELRFLRFCIQSNAPRFLGYRGDLESDRALLMRSLAGDGMIGDLRRRIAASLTTPQTD